MKKIIIIGAVVAAVAVATVLWTADRAVAPGPDADPSPETSYTGYGADECSRLQFLCVEGFERFDDDIGCGCRPISP